MVARDNRRPPLPEASQPRAGDSTTQRAFDSLFVPLRAVLKFLEPYVRQDDWTELTFGSTWGHTGDPYERGSFRKDPWGRVRLEGVVTRSAGALTTIATLPQGFRPAKSLVFPVWTTGGFSSIVVTSGGVVTYNGAAGGLSVSLSSVCFDTRSA